MSPDKGGCKRHVAYVTLQFHAGGLFDSRATEDVIHLVRQMSNGGTPGPTLCGRERFGPDAPGWSVGGGISGTWLGCPGCSVRRDERLSVRGMHQNLFVPPRTPEEDQT